MSKEIIRTLILITVLVMFGLITRYCNRSEKLPEPRIIYIHDSIPYETIKKVPEPYTVIDTFWRDSVIWKYREIDTLAILQDYFRLRVYIDTIINTDELFVSLQDTIYQNKLWGSRGVTYRNYRPVGVEVTCPEISRYDIYLGIKASTMFGIGPSIGVRRSNSFYQYDYDIVNNVHNVGIHWKLNTQWKILPLGN